MITDYSFLASVCLSVCRHDTAGYNWTDAEIREDTLRGAYKYWATVQRLQRQRQWKQNSGRGGRGRRPQQQQQRKARDPTSEDHFLVKYLNLRWTSPHFRALEQRWVELEKNGSQWGPDEDQTFLRSHGLRIAEDFTAALADVLVRASSSVWSGCHV